MISTLGFQSFLQKTAHTKANRDEGVAVGYSPLSSETCRKKLNRQSTMVATVTGNKAPSTSIQAREKLE
jgi:hypothetical protein